MAHGNPEWEGGTECGENVSRGSREAELGLAGVQFSTRTSGGKGTLAAPVSTARWAMTSLSQPLQAVVEHMAGRLQVRPEQILLLLRDVELPPSSTPQGLGLGVADIIGTRTPEQLGMEPDDVIEAWA
ncbi:NFATC2-interacting protein [Chelonia mydas]|uniref:NFATC2-interacting protein n=1 Tax=Chelonia mydas TaxID=8469 RepID=M7CAJ7_CHEMY|nr:NFATC2-interacting protein [Chelonia mydas]